MEMMSVITCTNRNEMMGNVFHNYLLQTIKHKELIIILNKDDMDISVWKKEARKYPSVYIYQIPEGMTVSDCKNEAIQKATYQHIAKFDDDDFYAPSYLQSAWQTFQSHQEADIVGKSSVYYYFEEQNLLCLFPSLKENTWTDYVVDSTLVFKKKIFNQVTFRKQKVGSDKRFQRDCHMMGFHIFSTDRYNHAVVRRNNQHHTWNIREKQFMNICSEVIYTDNYQAIVTR